MKQVARTKRLELNLEETPIPYMLESLKQSEDDVKNGRLSPRFTKTKDAIAWLNDSNVSYENGDKVHDEI